MNTKEPLSLTAIILTYNEAIHIERCINNLKQIAERIIIVDSFSNDQTIELVKALGVEFYQNPFITQAQQFQWALDHIPVTSDWTLRVDTDEYLLPEMINELRQKLPQVHTNTTGFYVKMRVVFLDKWIKRGYYPMILLRLWRTGAAYIQQKWMDEHTILKYGEAQMLENDMVDHNLNHLGWWTDKHNRYSIREAIERLNHEYQFMGDRYATEHRVGNKSKWQKSVYLRLPLFLRPFLYFTYRYIFRGGFLEGRSGLVWHILQGFWFQFLVDAKIYQIKHIARKTGKSVKAVLVEDFGVKSLDL